MLALQLQYSVLQFKLGQTNRAHVLYISLQQILESLSVLVYQRIFGLIQRQRLLRARALGFVFLLNVHLVRDMEEGGYFRQLFTLFRVALVSLLAPANDVILEQIVFVGNFVLLVSGQKRVEVVPFGPFAQNRKVGVEAVVGYYRFDYVHCE